MTRKAHERRWPEWLEPLRPDDVSRQRMLRAIMDRARPILERREPDWFDVAAGWATILAPIAAVITLVFIGVALQALQPTTVADRTEPAADLEYVLQVATMYEAP